MKTTYRKSLCALRFPAQQRSSDQCHRIPKSLQICCTGRAPYKIAQNEPISHQESSLTESGKFREISSVPNSNFITNTLTDATRLVPLLPASLLEIYKQYS